MLYTIYDVDSVMEAFDDEETGAAQTVEVARPNGATLIVRAKGLQEGELERVISSDPNDYLDPALQPGSKIRFHPAFM